MFYAPWCGFCKELAPTWELLSDKFEQRNDVIIAKIDGTVNEVEDVKVGTFPTLKFFPQNSDQMIEYPRYGNRTIEALVKFVETGGELPEEPKPPEDTGSSAKKDEL